MGQRSRAQQLTHFGRAKDSSDTLMWYGTMVNAAAHMTEEERLDFEEWVAANVDGSGQLGSSDWPGWARHIDMELSWPFAKAPGERHSDFERRVRAAS